MIVLLNLVLANIAGLFSGVVFDEPGGVARALREYAGTFPDKRSSIPQGEDFPYIFTSLDGFDITREGIRYKVKTEIGIFAADGTDKAALLSSIVVGLAPLAIQRFAPYRLIGDAVCTINDENSPYFMVAIEMVFRDHN